MQRKLHSFPHIASKPGLLIDSKVIRARLEPIVESKESLFCVECSCNVHIVRHERHGVYEVTVSGGVLIYADDIPSDLNAVFFTNKLIAHLKESTCKSPADDVAHTIPRS